MDPGNRDLGLDLRRTRAELGRRVDARLLLHLHSLSCFRRRRKEASLHIPGVLYARVRLRLVTDLLARVPTLKAIFSVCRLALITIRPRFPSLERIIIRVYQPEFLMCVYVQPRGRSAQQTTWFIVIQNSEVQLENSTDSQMLPK